jgi:hypothetical protein
MKNELPTNESLDSGLAGGRLSRSGSVRYPRGVPEVDGAGEGLGVRR